MLKITRQPYLRGSERAGFYCGFSLDVRGAQASTHHMILNSPYFQKKMDTLLASADMDIRNQCIRTALSSLADTFFENNVNSMDMNKFRDRVHSAIVLETQKNQICLIKMICLIYIGCSMIENVFFL
ncbi:hypothetical protein [Escherichia coli]|uniref:hypothetical protein n=1 Tax=Escherichia coli TaxID=562 RepID=UPI0025A12F06|nr:hypothetical protein [Escherichia coli]MDM6722396.1 hypothetical protein [Escherichia coli]